MKKIDYNTIETPTNPFEFQEALRRHVENCTYTRDPELIKVYYNTTTNQRGLRSVVLRIEDLGCRRDIWRLVWAECDKDRRLKKPDEIYLPIGVSFDWEDTTDNFMRIGPRELLEEELADQNIAEWFDYSDVDWKNTSNLSIPSGKYLCVSVRDEHIGVRIKNVIERLFGVFEPQYMHDWVYPMREEMKEEKQMQEWDKELNANNNKAACKMTAARRRMR